MPGNSYIQTSPSDTVPLARYADWLWVFRLVVDPKSTDSSNLKWYLELLPNIVCSSITIREGAHPPVAQFRYVFSPDLLPPEFPSRFHQVYGRVKKGPGVVTIDDRLVVVRLYDDGTFGYLFDGFVTSPSSVVDGRGENVMLTAHGSPVREWDFTLPGAMWSTENFSDSDKYDKGKDPAPKQVPYWFTEVPARFNPNGQPNASADLTEWYGKYYFTDVPFKAFVAPNDQNKYADNDSSIFGDSTPPAIKRWTIATAAQYVVGLGIEWPFGFNLETSWKRELWRTSVGSSIPYVSVYDINAWNDLLKAIVPKDDTKPVDLSDPSTYTREDIGCPDIEVTGDAWPHALEKIIVPFGFHFRFDLRVDESDGPTKGMPEWYLTVYRIDDPHNRVLMYLQDPSDRILNPGSTNVGGVTLGHEAVGVANEFEVDTELVQYEATFILAPAFPIAAADADEANRPQWIGEHADPTKRDYYRKFIFGEGGDPIWRKIPFPGTFGMFNADASLIYPLFNLIFSKDDAQYNKYAPRRRRPFGHLATRMPDGRPYNARLSLSNMSPDTGKYTGNIPDLWNNTGVWHTVTSTDWHILDDCIGVRISCEDPNSWHAGRPKEDVDYPFPDRETGAISIVEALNGVNGWGVVDKPLGGLVIALTCSVFSDFDLEIIAERRKVSPTQFRIRRKVDHRDRLKRLVQTKYSQVAVEISPGLADAGWSNKRDDTTIGQYQADAYRRAHECGSHAGRVEMRRLTTAYNVGQTVVGILGRNVDLQINSGAPSGETPLWPRIQSMTWTLEPEQTTQVNLTDERADPPARRVALQLRQAGMRHRG